VLAVADAGMAALSLDAAAGDAPPPPHALSAAAMTAERIQERACCLLPFKTGPLVGKGPHSEQQGALTSVTPCKDEAHTLPRAPAS
jgi:hypothetical protein